MALPMRILPPVCLAILAMPWLIGAEAGDVSTAAGKPALDEAIAQLRIPPPWLEDVSLGFDMSQPWNKAWDRIEVLLFTAEPADRRKAVKLAYVYQADGRAKEGYPAAVYFLAGELAWALVEHEKLSSKNCAADLRLAACYRHFGASAKAHAALDRAALHVRKPPWDVYDRGRVSEARGDVYDAMAETGKARNAYQAAIRQYAAVAPQKPRERLLVSRSITRAEAKLELVDRAALNSAKLRDGVYVGTAFGYSDTIHANVTVTGGRIARIDLQHKERADLGAKHIIPRRIVDRQTVDVDGVTGATVTSSSIKSAVFRALKRAAGLSAP